MTTFLTRAALAGTVTALAGSAVLVAAPGAQAAPTPPRSALNAFVSLSPGAGCTGASPTSPAEVSAPLNGGPSSITNGQAVTVSDGTNVTDVTTRTTLTATPPVLGPSGGRFVVSGNASMTVRPRTTSGACSPFARAGSDYRADFDIAVPTWITVTVSGRGTTASPGDGDVRASIQSSAPLDSPTFKGDYAQVSTGARGDSTLRVLAPVGRISLNASLSVSAQISNGVPTVESRSLNGSVVVDMQPAGFAPAATGKARKLVVAGNRDCARNAIGVSVTRKADKRAKKVVVKVTGRKAITLKGKKLRKRTLVLPVAASAPATVKSTVVLKNGKRLTTTRSYLACAD